MNGEYLSLNPIPNKNLLIIGGCGGIGQAIIQHALENKLNVAVFDLKKSIKQSPPPKEVMAFKADATKKKELQKAMKKLSKKWDGIDYLVNLVGFITEFNPIEEYSEDGWQAMIGGNINPTFLGNQVVIPYLSKGGAIVNMTSGLGFGGMKGYGPYSASKAAIVSLTKTLANELAPYIRVNCVAPGAVQTAFLSGGLGHGGKMGKAAKRVNLAAYKKIVPLGTIATPAEIAAPIMFLLGEGAKHITGETLHINGGAMMR